MSTEHDEWGSIADAAEARTVSWLLTIGVDVGSVKFADLVAQGGASERRDLLEGVRSEADSFAFAQRLLDAVIGASDPFAAALGLREASRDLPQSMPMVERAAVRAGGLASLGLPWAVLPMARKWLRERVSHLVLSAKIVAENDGRASFADVREALRELAGAAAETTIALRGRRLLGDAGAEEELRRLTALAVLPELTHLSVDTARIVPAGLNREWTLDHDVKTGAKRLRALLRIAAEHGVAVTLEASDYRSAMLAPQVLATALAEPGLEEARVGIMLAAELPESLLTAGALVQFSRERISAGAQPLDIGICIAGFSSHEQIRSIVEGHPVPTLETLAEQRAQWWRVLAELLAAGDAVHVTAASEDTHLLAAATVLAERTASPLTLQLRAGVAPELEAAIREHGYAVRSRLPLVPSHEFDAAASYLIALAAEATRTDSVLLHTRALLAGEFAELQAGAERMRGMMQLAVAPAPHSHRVQRRDIEWSDRARNTTAFYRSPTEAHLIDTGGLTAAVLGLTRAHTGAITTEVIGEATRIPNISATGFANEPDTDASRFDNREWVRRVLARAKRSDIGLTAMQQAMTTGEDRETLVAKALEASDYWATLRPAERATRVGRLALGMASARDRMFEVLAAESGLPVPVIDAEVSAAIDAARYYGHIAGGLGTVRGAEFEPDSLMLVVADAGVALGERAEAILAALAAGSCVLLVAHNSIARSSAVLLEEWQAAGLPVAAVSLVVAQPDEIAHVELGAILASDARIERALVLGDRDLARTLLRRRPDLQVAGRFRATGVSVITPTADPLLAVRHAVASAFGASHHDPRVARALVLLGGAARSKVLRAALVDAVQSLRVGHSARPKGVKGVKYKDPLSIEVGPLAAPPSEAGLRALTELAAGEHWLVQPEQLDDAGLLWRPGIRGGVSRESSFWQDSIGVPVMGIIAAHSVDEVISLTNDIGGGGVAAIHSNDPAETLPWLERARAASLCVGKPTTHTRIERQPVGGVDEAGIGSGVLAGGPNRLVTLGEWRMREGTASSTLHLRGLKPEVRLLIEIAQASLDYASFDRVRRAALSDTLTWRTVLGKAEDVTGLGVERNLLRYLPVATHVRLDEGERVADLVRVVCAGLIVGAPMTVSTGVVLPPDIAEFLARQGVTVSLERDDDWLERVSVAGPGDGETLANRVRLIGANRVRAAEWLGGLGEFTLWAQRVTMAGPIELLAFVQEQAITITAHRHDLAMLPSGVGSWIAELQGRS